MPFRVVQVCTGGGQPTQNLEKGGSSGMEGIACKVIFSSIKHIIFPPYATVSVIHELFPPHPRLIAVANSDGLGRKSRIAAVSWSPSRKTKGHRPASSSVKSFSRAGVHGNRVASIGTNCDCCRKNCSGCSPCECNGRLTLITVKTAIRNDFVIAAFFEHPASVACIIVGVQVYQHSQKSFTSKRRNRSAISSPVKSRPPELCAESFGAPRRTLGLLRRLLRFFRRLGFLRRLELAGLHRGPVRVVRPECAARAPAWWGGPGEHPGVDRSGGGIVRQKNLGVGVGIGQVDTVLGRLLGVGNVLLITLVMMAELGREVLLDAAAAAAAAASRGRGGGVGTKMLVRRSSCLGVGRRDRCSEAHRRCDGGPKDRRAG